MNPMDIAAISAMARQAFVQNTKDAALLRMAMDNTRIQAQGLAQMAPAEGVSQLATLTGKGRYVDVTL